MVRHVYGWPNCHRAVKKENGNFKTVINFKQNVRSTKSYFWPFKFHAKTIEQLKNIWLYFFMNTARIIEPAFLKYFHICFSFSNISGLSLQPACKLDLCISIKIFFCGNNAFSILMLVLQVCLLEMRNFEPLFLHFNFPLL